MPPSVTGPACSEGTGRRRDRFELLPGGSVSSVSPVALARWGEIFLVEDDAKRAVRRGAAGVSDPTARVLIRGHRISREGAAVAGSREYLPRDGRDGAAVRLELALELIDEVAPKRAIVVCGPSYGVSPRFLHELALRRRIAIVEIRPSSVLELARRRIHKNAVSASELLDGAEWRRFVIPVPGLPLHRVAYSAARIGVGRVRSSPSGLLFAALTGGIDSVHRGTIFGFSLEKDASLSELLQAVGWARWIRPLIRRAERSGQPTVTPYDASPAGPNGSRPRLRANITLSRIQDSAAASRLSEEANRHHTRGALAQGAPINVVELFAGAGGMGLGFLLAEPVERDSQYRLIYSGEVDPIYVQTLRANHQYLALMRPELTPASPAGTGPVDLRTKSALNEAEGRARAWGGADLVIGGPPCQGFSSANRNSWHSSNPHNRLIDVFMTYVRRLQPKAFLLENVQGIHWTRSSGAGPRASFLEYIDARMAKAGYQAFVHLLDAVWYGVPQYRSRFFVLGLHTDLGYSRDDFGQWGPFPRPTHGPGTGREYTTVQDAIGDLPPIANGHLEEVGYFEPSRSGGDYLRYLRLGTRRGALTDHVTSRHADYVIERYKRIPPGGNWESIADSLTNYADVKRTHSNIYRRLKWTEPSITIGHYRKSMLVHPSQHRGLSLREAARLQSFPDWFRFAGSATGGPGGLVHKQQQLANAVCPLVTKAIAQLILEL